MKISKDAILLINDEDRATEFCGDILSGDYEDSDLKPLDIVRLMYTNDNMPEEVSLWEPFENYSPRYLVEQYYL